jgi:hypothetical protein
MAQWHDLPTEIKSQIIREVITSLYHKSTPYPNQDFPVRQFQSFCSLVLTSHEFRHLCLQVRVLDLNSRQFFQSMQCRLLSSMSLTATLEGEDLEAEGFVDLRLELSLVQPIVGKFWRNPQILSNPELALHILQLLKPQIGLFVAMEELFWNLPVTDPEGDTEVQILDPPMHVEDNEELPYYEITPGGRVIKSPELFVSDVAAGEITLENPSSNGTLPMDASNRRVPFGPFDDVLPEIQNYWLVLFIGDEPLWYLIDFNRRKVYDNSRQQINNFEYYEDEVRAASGG